MGNELTIGIVFTAAILDSINPCVLGVLIFLITFMTKLFQNRNKMLLGGVIYTATVYATYLALGFGILELTLNTQVAGVFYWMVAILAILAGLLELKDYFLYGSIGFCFFVLCFRQYSMTARG